MANAIGYEQLVVRNTPVGPTSSIVGGRVGCAVFYVDPKAQGAVRWRPRSTGSDTTTSDPTGHKGFPLNPGKWISIAGEGIIRNSQFVLDYLNVAEYVIVHVLYFDRVDVVAADFADDSSAKSLKEIATDISRIRDNTDDMLTELRKHTDALVESVERELIPETRR